MRKGIYIVANDKVMENAIAFLSSVRVYDPDLPVFMIPFNQDYEQTLNKLNTLFKVQLYPDLDFLESLTQTIADIFPRDFLALPNKMRKLAVWFGPLDDFLYVDIDIIVFRSLTDSLAYLDQADFICCDYHFKGRKLRDIFSPTVLEQGIFTPEDMQDVFNSGFWGSKKGAITYDQMVELLKTCAQHREYFDFSGGTTDQPIMNFLVLSAIANRLNIVQANPQEPGSWGGSSHFQERDHILYDGDQPLRYLHWAGTPMRSGAPYRDIWEHYRYLHEPKPEGLSPSVAPSPPTVWQRLKQWFK